MNINFTQFHELNAQNNLQKYPNDSSFLFHLTVSIASFGMLAGSLIAGPMANLVGRKWTSILGTCFTLSLSYSLIPFAQQLWMILLARFLMGAGERTNRSPAC